MAIDKVLSSDHFRCANFKEILIYLNSLYFIDQWKQWLDTSKLIKLASNRKKLLSCELFYLYACIKNNRCWATITMVIEDSKAKTLLIITYKISYKMILYGAHYDRCQTMYLFIEHDFASNLNHTSNAFISNNISIANFLHHQQQVLNRYFQYTQLNTLLLSRLS